MGWLFNKRDREIDRLNKNIKDLKSERSAMYKDIVTLIGNDKLSEYHLVKQKWRMIVDFENTLWSGDRDGVGRGIIDHIEANSKK